MNMKNKSCLYARYVYQLHIHTLDVSKCESCSFALKVQTTKVRADAFIELLNFWGNINSFAGERSAIRVSSLE